MILVPRERIEEFRAKGWWGSRTMGELFLENAARAPQREAVVDPPNKQALVGVAPRRLTYAELVAEVGRMVAVLRAQGLRKDDVVVVQMANGIEQYQVYLACACLGIIVCPVPVQYREHELDYVIDKTEAVLAITQQRIGRSAHAAMWAALAAQHASLRAVWAYGDELPAGVLPLSALLAQAEPVPADAMLDAGVSADDVFSICWTSGTEANPKGVPRSHNEWLIVGLSVKDAAELSEGARVLNPFPFVNMAGISTGLASWLMLRGTVVQHHPFDLDVFLGQLRDEAVHYTIAAPALLNQLLQQPDKLAGIDFKRLSRIGSGSAPLSEWLVRGFAERHGVQIINYFGSNEGAALSSTPGELPDPAQRAAFFPRIGVDGFNWSAVNAGKVRTRLVDPDTGEEISESGRPGELRFAGATIFSGYYRAPELTARAFDDQGYYRTGDLFEIAGDRNQFYRFVGRSKDLVIRGGMNISSEEIENLVIGHPAVAEAAMVGWPDETMGERVCVFAVLRAGHALTLAELVAYLREQCRVAAFKLPEHLIQIDALPRNPVGKVLKRELREEAARRAQAA
ncbi:MAG: acyl--CoA ligase [Burkholderiales bacterium]|nr:acyl--CoA ligase [Burkholderiales bacterium]